MTAVFHAMAGARFGGAEAFFCRLLPALTRAGITQQAAIRAHETRQKILTEAGIDVHTLPFGGFFDYTTRRQLARQVKNFAPDIFFAWMNRAAGYSPKGDHTNIGRLGGYYDLKYYRHCDHLIANTRDICDYIIANGWPAKRCHYLPNFVDGAQGEALDRRDFDTPSDAPLLLAMGRMHENKAFDLIIEAMTGVPNVYLWLAGDGPLRQALSERAHQLGVDNRIRFLGWRDDTGDLLATCDVFVCPSRHEPLGNVVLEAWAQRKPVIAAKAQGPNALIDHNRTGLLVPIDDAKAMGTAIREVVNSTELSAALADSGFNAYQERFTEARVVALYCEFLEMVKR
ncbi:MAG: glycosyltransferase [Proteobacteria bacterium]|nr:glycosyltransferase [Pseudomonadota bacterium]